MGPTELQFELGAVDGSLEAADLLDTADWFEAADLLEVADLFEASDLLVVDCLATETSEGAFMVDVLEAADLLDTEDRDDDMTERALLLGRCQLPDQLEVDDLVEDTCDSAFSLVTRGRAYPLPLSTRGETWPLPELYDDAALEAMESCISRWSSTFASLMYWPQPRRVHFIHRSLGSDCWSTSDGARLLWLEMSGDRVLMTKGESSVCTCSICSLITYESPLS